MATYVSFVADPSSDEYVLAESLEVAQWSVPEGFNTDGASIPPLLWPVIGSPFRPRFVRAAVLHDWLYRTGTHTRSEADKIFREVLWNDGVGWRAWVMWAGVRLGGWLFWHRVSEDRQST